MYLTNYLNRDFHYIDISASMSITSNTVILLLLILPYLQCSPLADLYLRAMKRRDDLIQDELSNLIKSSVPSGIDAPQPKIAEYETFKQSPDANFIRDGNGKLHFRQFRRINLNAAMNRQAGI